MGTKRVQWLPGEANLFSDVMAMCMGSKIFS